MTHSRKIQEGEIEQPHHSDLSEREFDVMLLFGEGLTTQEVADRLHLSSSTVRTYLECPQ